jgi:general secretion pathway protein A
MLRNLNEFAINELKENRAPPVVILDEAQDLSHDVLEEVRLLTNLEISQSKLLQVVLSGQPELETTLHESRLRQLRQRIAVYIRLRSLTRREVYEYVAHRLRVAGCCKGGLFTQDATFYIWSVSGGIPRVINMICEQSLINAFGAAKQRVDLSLVEEAVRDLDLIKEDDAKNSFWKRTFRWRKPALRASK